MNAAPISIGVIDSGLSGPLAGRMRSAKCFTGDADVSDALGHGTRVCEVICNEAPHARLIVAKVFGTRPVTQPAMVAEALDWLLAQGAAIINMSFGLTLQRKPLAEACARAHDAGIVLVASAPAQGLPCYPAAHDGVIAVAGDARCETGMVSVLDGIAAFGTWCASPERVADAAISGASIAAAHFTGLSANWLAANPGAMRDDLVAHWREVARYHGREHRTAPRHE
jgi:hypothetical protein